MEQRCIECKELFEFDEEFYKRRGFTMPKRCSDCAAEIRGRKALKQKRSCLLRLSNAFIDIPDDFIKNPIYLKRTDEGKKGMKGVSIERISCLRFYVCPKEATEAKGYITIYDQRNTNPEKRVPLSGDSAKAAVRIMHVGGEDGYDYIVLDCVSDETCEAILTVSEAFPKSRDNKGQILWLKDGESWGKDNILSKWWLGAFTLEDSLGEELCRVSQVK